MHARDAESAFWYDQRCRETGGARGAATARIYNPIHAVAAMEASAAATPAATTAAAAAAAAAAATAAARATSFGAPVPFPPLIPSPWATTPPPAAVTPAASTPGDDWPAGTPKVITAYYKISPQAITLARRDFGVALRKALSPSAYEGWSEQVSPPGDGFQILLLAQL